MATVVQALAQGLPPWFEVRVLDNTKTTPVDRSLPQAVRAQLELLGRLLVTLAGWRPALVHVHTCSGFTFWRNALDVLCARLAGCSVLLHVHGGRFDQFLGGLGAGRRWLARWVLRWPHRVVVLSEGWRDTLAPWVPPTRLAVVPNGVAVAEAPAPRSPYLAPTVVCMGGLEPPKGQRELVRALALLTDLPEVRLALLGPETASGERDTLLGLAEALGLGARVVAPGPVMGEAKARHLAEASVFCLPSHYEGLPMALLEAMAAGLPVVATRVGAIPEVVREGIDGFLVEPGDVESLAARLKGLLRDPGAARAMGEAGRAAVAGRFSVDQSLERVRGLYAELGVEGRAPGSSAALQAGQSCPGPRGL
jgi:glycosyltransferase involved in cell wall biosynthesis